MRDDSGLSMFKKVTLRKDCEVCGGTGRIAETETLHTHFCVTRRPRRAEAPATGKWDRLLGWLLALALVAYVSFQLASEPYGMAVWIRTGIALTVSLMLWVALKKSAGATRLLQRLSVVFVLLVMFGDLALGFVRH